jgi:hypothetical protein
MAVRSMSTARRHGLPGLRLRAVRTEVLAGRNRSGAPGANAGDDLPRHVGALWMN